MSMPMTPAPPSTSKPPRLATWHRRVLGICLVLFAFELGVFLLIYPWLGVWDFRIPMHSAWFSKLWLSSYFRGALSGLGVLNMYIAFTEGVRQIKVLFSQSGTPSEPRR